ncbi:hypothetical protein KA005_06250, partial [bacterium]|nr:hypothetical protein [bacterium]
MICIVYFLYQEASPSKYVNLSQILTRAAALPRRKYIIFITLVIVPFLISTYAINKYFEIKETQPKEVQRYTKRKEKPKMSRKKKLDHLAKFNANEFFENITEFKGYIVNRKRRAKLNPDKLINLLYVYFRSVLLFPSPDMHKYYLTGPDGKSYVIEFPGHTKAGERRLVSLGEMSHTLLDEICSHLLKSAQLAQIISLVELFTKAIATPNLDKHHKFNILNAENMVLKEKFTDAIRMMPEKKAKEALDIRESLAFSELQALEQAEDKSDAENEKNREWLYNILTKYIRCRIDVLIANNKFIDIFQFLYEEL